MIDHKEIISLKNTSTVISQIARFMGPTRGSPGSCRPQMGPMLAPWTLLSGMILHFNYFDIWLVCKCQICHSKKSISFDLHGIKTLGPSDDIWQQKSESILAQVMACYLVAPIHYLGQCWFIISNVLWHSFEGDFIKYLSPITKIILKIN